MEPSRRVYWVCDKMNCHGKNYRTVFDREYLGLCLPPINVDDVCDQCGQDIHEPLYIDIETKESRKND
jgi:hypothetical protein